MVTSRTKKNNTSMYNILVVEDNPKDIKIIKHTLANIGSHLEFVDTGEDALSYPDIGNIDLILLDVMLPEMDGYEVCKRIKNNVKTKHIPVIFLTAKTDTEDIVKGFEAGAVDYVTKPYNAMEFLTRVQTQAKLKKTFDELKVLRGIFPICIKCKKIRGDKGYWERVEVYVEEHTDVEFSHGLCPQCVQQLYPDVYRQMQEEKELHGE